MMRRHESVQRQERPMPFRHPHFQNARDKQAEAFRDEIAAYLRESAERAKRLAGARIHYTH